MLDLVLVAHALEDVLAVADVACAFGELDAVVRQHGVDRVGHGLDQVAQALGCFPLACAFQQADKGELAGAIYCDL